jgi:hypothetical protein
MPSVTSCDFAIVFALGFAILVCIAAARSVGLASCPLVGDLMRRIDGAAPADASLAVPRPDFSFPCFFPCI